MNKIIRVTKKDIMYNVVIKFFDNAHHCELLKSFLQYFSRSVDNKCKFDLKKIDTTLGLLKSSPNLKPFTLRPLLTECVP